MLTLVFRRVSSPGHTVRYDGALPFTAVRLIEIALVPSGMKVFMSKITC